MTPKFFDGGEYLLLQLEIRLAKVAEALAQGEGKTILDAAPAKDLLRLLLEQMDWLTPNDSETRTVGISDKEFDAVQGAYALRERGAINVAPEAKPARRHIVCGERDPTAVDCAFNGVFAVALAQEQEVAEPVRFATIVA